MPLVFSPLGEAVLDTPPPRLLPKHAFVLRQLGGPPEIDLRMTAVAEEVFSAYDIAVIDADHTTASKDYLSRILDLIRSTGFTIAVFSGQTRSSAMANIALELGFAAMCGKPLIIAKSHDVEAPSDLKRTDWVTYRDDDEDAFRRRLHRAATQLSDLVDYERTLLGVALEAHAMDGAVALERALKGFLLSSANDFVDAGSAILERIDAAGESRTIVDLERLRAEVRTFVDQARRAIAPTP